MFAVMSLTGHVKLGCGNEKKSEAYGRRKVSKHGGFLDRCRSRRAPPAIANKQDNLLTVPDQAQLITTSAPLPSCASSVTLPSKLPAVNLKSSKMCMFASTPLQIWYETDRKKLSKKLAVCTP